MNKKPHANLSIEKKPRGHTKKTWYIKTALILCTLFLFLSCDPEGDKKDEKVAKLATPQSFLPSRPNDVVEGQTAVIISWAPVLEATGYQIQQRQGSGAWADFTPSPAFTGSSTRTTISGLTAGTSYSFRIRALKTGKDSDYSAALLLSTLAAGATALTNTPANLKASAPKEIAKQSTGVDLSWTALVEDKVWGYEIQYHTKDNAWTETTVKVKSVAGKSTASLSINDLTADTKSYFRIRAAAPPSDSATAPSTWSASTAMLYPASRAALQALINPRINANPSSDLTDIYIGKITDMTALFANKGSFNGDISSWNTAKVTSMSSMFGRATSFNGDLSGWNTSAVTNMFAMFSEATSFNGDISGWDTIAVKNMSFMFQKATSFNGDISAWNTSAVTDMSFMFDRATSFNANISNWNTAIVTTMEKMFINASIFNQDLSGWDVSQVTNSTNIFTGSAMTSANKPGRFRNP